ncbi:MAG: hypothetical protein DVB23_001124 [Verrucomicrobia bacterium]|jgi:hypothetical protein|nr:MAG: hypothetical protein DVB23_001124 [Verrucomicrobiota bacterium]
MTFIQRVPLFLFVFIVFNLVMAAAPDMVVPHIIDDPAPVETAAPAPEAPAEPAPAPAAATEPAPVPPTTPPPETAPAPAPPATTAPAPAAAAAAETDAKPAPSLPSVPSLQTMSNAGRVSLSVKPLFKVQLPSGLFWYPTMNDVLLLFAVIVLYVELIKSARAPSGSIVEHMFSMFVFCAFLVEFLVNKSAGTSAFLIVTMLALIDVVAGFMLASARGSFPVKN